MKKINVFLLSFLPVIVIVLSIIIMNHSRGGQDYMNAIVLEVKETSVIVEVLDMGDKDNHSLITGKEHIIINTDTINKSACPDLNEGDTIRVVYDSDSIKKEPLRIETVYAIYDKDAIAN